MPEEWVGTTSLQPYGSQHDQARPPSSPGDCTDEIHGETRSFAARGHKMSYSITVGGEEKQVRARMKYTNENTAKMTAYQTWKIVGTSQPAHYLFVRDGIDADGEENRTGCFRDSPSKTWTHSGGPGMQNPPLQPPKICGKLIECPFDENDGG